MQKPRLVRALGVVVEEDDCMLGLNGEVEYVVEVEGTPYSMYPDLIEDEEGQKAYGCRRVGQRLHCDTVEV